MPKASGVIIICQAGKICAVRHVVVVIRSLNILIMNKELNLLIHAKTTKHSLSFTSFLLIVVMQRWILLGVILYSYGSTENNIPKSYKESYLISMRNLPTF